MLTSKILMFCLGNICRSPLAKGVLENKILSSTYLDSNGTATYHVGNPPDSRSINVGEKNGIDISQFKARKFIKEDFKNFSHIFVMDNSNFNNVLNLAQLSKHEKKIRLILDSEQEVPDPYYGGLEEFDSCYALLDIACDQIVNELNL